ncbi:MAG: putative nudix hydrolase [Candidatus Berkelbacteria bacterium Gr01-1014_85]|uniref:Putative nudix hydrolase n=1 Tax=Candidatus Berkelbacteria bacterium Gr01-1014_85 TaxID=2017150 RepID=A0A554JBK9_9BACT|nr:MAG: putative nudix hydrolase [Candidatus Berkelbacteria bacterium Gr01-1014_85]
MQSKVDHDSIEQLVAESRRDGVQKLVVGAVICIDDKFLLLERLPSDFMGGLVELPSGTVDVGEDLLTALVREVREETGLVVTSILAYLSLFDYTSGSGKKTRQFNFLVQTAPDEIKLEPTEHQAHYCLAPSDDAFNTLNISDATRAVIQTALRQ